MIALLGKILRRFGILKIDSSQMVEIAADFSKPYGYKNSPYLVAVKKRKAKHSKKQECYANAVQEAINNGADYVLGYVFVLGVPIEHAWNKKYGVYYDVTLNPKNQDGYVVIVEIAVDEIRVFSETQNILPIFGKIGL